MEDKKKTKQQLLQELSALRKEVAALRKAQDSCNQAHECSSKSEDKYKLVFDNMGDAVVIRSLDGHILEVNPTACARLGYKREELLNMRVESIIGDKYVDSIELRAKLIAQNGHLSYESENKTKDGTTVSTEVTARFVKFDGMDAILAISRDISKRKLDQKVLLESEERYRTAVENSNDGVLISVSGKTVFCNKKLATMFGYDSVKDLIGRRRDLIVNPSDLGRTIQMHKDRLAGKAVPDKYEIKGIRKDGCTIIIEASVAKIMFNGKPATLAYIRDITDRKRTEEALQKSEDMYRRIVETTNEGIWTLDENFCIAFVNKQLAEMLGYEPEDIVGRSVSDFSFAENLPEILARRNRRKQGYSEYYEWRFQRRDGSVLWANASSTPIMGEKNKFLGSFGMFTDITQRKLFEKALVESEQKYRSIFENAMEGIFQVTPEGRFSAANPALAKMHGFDTPEEFLSNIAVIEEQLCVYPETRKDLLKLLGETGVATGFEILCYRKDRSIFWVSLNVRVVKDANGDILYYEGIVEDITVRKQAQEELFHSRQMLQSVLDHIPQRVFWKDPDLNYLGCNIAFTQDAGLTDPNAVVGKNDFELPWKATAEKYRSDDRMVLETGLPRIDYQESAMRSDGSEGWLQTSKIPLRDQAGNIFGVLGMSSDITQRKQAEEALREKERALRALLDATPETALLIDTNSVILAANKTAADRFGIPLEECIGSHMFSRHSDISLARKRYEMLIKAKETKRLVRFSDVRDGRSYDAYYNPIINENGEIDKIAVFAMDVTERKILERRLLEVCDMERQQIGQDVHDSLGQYLTGIMLTATLLYQRLKKKSLPEASEAEKLMSIINRAMAISRGLAKGLCPITLTGDILSALKELALSAEDIYGISCNFTCTYPTPITDSATATHLYRIAQEALNNAVKHGHAKHVKIDLVTLNGSITLSIEDDGVGFQGDITRGQGMGLYIMENRARAINGSINIHRNRHGGTTIVHEGVQDSGQRDTSIIGGVK